MIICPKCNKQLEDGSLFCDECGASLVQQPAATPEQEPAPVPEAKKPALDIKKIAVIGVAAVAIIAIVLLLGSLLFGGSSPEYALYLKDEQLYYSNFKKDFEATEDFNVKNATDLSTCFHLTDDGQKLFYLDDGDNLYYRNPTKPKKEAVKLDSGVGAFVVSENGKLVTYLKDSDLYQHDLKEKSKLEKDVADYVVSLDGKKIVFTTTEDNDLYIKNGSKDAEKIDSGIGEIVHISKDFKKIYYLKDAKMYLKAGSKEKAKLCSDVESVIKMYDSGEFYYIEAKEEADSTEETPSISTSTNIIEQAMSSITKTLCYYNGKESKTVTEDYINSTANAIDDKQIISYSTFNAEDISEDDLNVGSMAEVMTLITEFTEWYVAFEDKSVEVDMDDVMAISISPDGKFAVAVTVEIDEDAEEDESGLESALAGSTGTVYKMKVSSGKIGKAEKVADDVALSSLSFSAKGDIIYFKDVEANKGTLYVGDQKIDDDVKCDSVIELEKSGKIIYFRDWDSEKTCGTLRISPFKSGKAKTIDDDVVDYKALLGIDYVVVTPDEDVLYIKDYKNGKGDLYRYSGSKAKLLSDDVVAIVPYESNTRAHYEQYGWIKD